jgi:hypothetical protein
MLQDEPGLLDALEVVEVELGSTADNCHGQAPALAPR